MRARSIAFTLERMMQASRKQPSYISIRWSASIAAPVYPSVPSPQSSLWTTFPISGATSPRSTQTTSSGRRSNHAYFDRHFGEHLANPIGLLSDCHRRIERFLHALLTVATRVAGDSLDAEHRRVLETALKYFRERPRSIQRTEKKIFSPGCDSWQALASRYFWHTWIGSKLNTTPLKHRIARAKASASAGSIKTFALARR